jgi:hypothetical protein
MTTEFFNKSKYIISKLSEYEVKPDVAFTVPYFIWDSVSLVIPTTITAKLVKVDGRNTTELPTVVTVVKLTDTSWSFSGTIAAVDWLVTQALSIKISVDGNVFMIPMVKV